MKITASKVSAILFTLIAIAAFTWMALRPNVNAQIVGFAMPVTSDGDAGDASNISEKASTSEEEIVAPSPALTDTTTEEKSTDSYEGKKDETNSAEKTSAETTVPTGDTPSLESGSQEQPTSSANSESVDTEATIEPISDEANKDETTKDEAIKDLTPSEESEVQQATDPEPVTLEDNKVEQQLVEKKKTHSESFGEFINENTVVDDTLKLEPASSNAMGTHSEIQNKIQNKIQSEIQSEIPDKPIENLANKELTNNELKAESTVTTEPEIKVATLTNSNATNATNAIANSNTTDSAPSLNALISPVIPIPTAETSSNDTASTTYTPAEKARGTVVILHGCDYQPKVQNSIVQTLHNNLPQTGWNTLSFQLPALSSSSNYQDLNRVMSDAAVAIEANIAIAIAKEKSQTPVVLLAHGCGSHMALAWMEVKGNDKIDAYIGIGTGMMNTSIKDIQHLSKPLEAMKFPQLDVFGSADNDAVLKTAPQRLGHINRAANPASRQKSIADADHNMTGKTELLSKIITTWLNKEAFTPK